MLKFEKNSVAKWLSRLIFSGNMSNFDLTVGGGGLAVAHLVETLLYKQEGRGFDPRWGQQNFSLASSFRPQYGLGVDSASNRN